MINQRHPVDTPPRAAKLLYQLLQVLDLKGLPEEFAVDISSFRAWYRKPGTCGAATRARFAAYRANQEYLIAWENGRSPLVLKGEDALLAYTGWSTGTLRQLMSINRGMVKRGKGAERCTITRLEPPSD